MNNQLALNGTYLEERHPVDDALGCMIPAALLGGIAIFGIIKLIEILPPLL